MATPTDGFASIFESRPQARQDVEAGEAQASPACPKDEEESPPGLYSGGVERRDRNPFASSMLSHESVRDYSEARAAGASESAVAPEPPQTPGAAGFTIRAGAREGSMQQGGKPPPFAAVPASQAQPPDPAGVKPEQEWTALELDLAASQAGCRAPLLCRASFWWQFFVVGVTLGLTLYGLYLRDLRSTACVFYLELWRWAFWLALVVPIYYGAGLCVHLLELGVESRFFTSRQAMYYAVSIKSPAAWLLRAVLLALSFLGVFSNTNRTEDAHDAWWLCVKLMACCTIGAVANVLKTLIAKLMATSFHKRAHFDKIQDALSKEYFLHALSQPRLHPAGSLAGRGSGTQDMGSQHDPLGLHWAGQALSGAVHNVLHPGLRRRTSSEGAEHLAGPGRRGSTQLASSMQSGHGSRPGKKTLGGRLQAWLWGRTRQRRKLLLEDHKLPVDQLMHHKPEARGGDATRLMGRGSTGSGKDAFWLAHLHALERHFRESKLHLTFADEMGLAQKEGDKAGQVTGTKEAQRLACFLFYNVVQDSNGQFITLADLRKFLTMQHARNALKALDADGDGRISLPDMRQAVQDICLKRKNLSLTLHDTHGVIGKLERIFSIVLHLVAASVYLIIFQVDVSQVWVTVSSVLLAFVFVFGNNVRQLYESVFLLFIVHPFDVGDCLLVQEAWHTVEEIALSVTQLRRWDGTRIWYPNTKLASEAVHNISRSGLRWEGFKVAVDISTPPEAFEAVDKAVSAFLKTQPTEFTGTRLVVANYAGDPLKYTLCVWWEYAQTGAELGRLSKARHMLYMAATAAIIEAGIRYTLPPYEGMGLHPTGPPPVRRPPGEGQRYMPPFLQRPDLPVP